ncbi:MAG: hypothetical protein V7719_17920 [Psychroserpens sp.]|uniref:hypothetical protein n=1 Tax=Psychroserpens sp. TaxID=2020870 RepID=UPI003002D1FF
MKNAIILLVFIALFQSCAITKGTENSTVLEAINLQSSVLNDELFYKILTELEEENGVDWSNGRMDKVNAQELSQYANNMSWLIAQYKEKGIYSTDEVFLWRKWNPFSSTRAVTTPCVFPNCLNTTKLNKWHLKRSKFSFTNTLIHERVHSFGAIHPNQSSRGNECDPSYVAGNLAEILLLYRHNQNLDNYDKILCPGLKSKLIVYGILNTP